MTISWISEFSKVWIDDDATLWGGNMRDKYMFYAKESSPENNILSDFLIQDLMIFLN